VATNEEQVARNEVLFREFNERVEDVAESFDIRGEGDSMTIDFVCECGRMDCLERIPVTRRQYESVRSNPRRFLTARGHEDPEVARVVEDHPDFLVVEKLEEAAEVAVENDPRAESG
jgi:hypothetical protein